MLQSPVPIIGAQIALPVRAPMSTSPAGQLNVVDPDPAAPLVIENDSMPVVITPDAMLLPLTDRKSVV